MNDIRQCHQQYKVAQSVLCNALNIPRGSYYRQQTCSLNKKVQKPPRNKLNPQEQQQVLDLLHSERFCNCTPYEVFYTLLDEGQYYCSVRTMYRILAERAETQDRRNQRCHRDAIKPELIAVRPNEVWSWDITKLLSTTRLQYYYLYVILDIYSRYVVGWMLAEKECQHLAKNLIQTSALRQGIQPGMLTLHADNGPSMTSGTVAQLLEHIGIAKSHNRPYTSNDNPFSESQFKTLKYCSTFPERFEHFEQAEQFCQSFFQRYNTMHFHSGVHYLTPEVVHYQRDQEVLEKRFNRLMQAYYENPCRFNNKKPTRKILQPVYINPPQTVEISSGQKGVAMA